MLSIREVDSQGVDATALLREAALDFGYRQLVLETGFRQTAAMRFYEASGFKRIAPFGKYVDDPTSVCYELVVPEA